MNVLYITPCAIHSRDFSGKGYKGVFGKSNLASTDKRCQCNLNCSARHTLSWQRTAQWTNSCFLRHTTPLVRPTPQGNSPPFPQCSPAGGGVACTPSRPGWTCSRIARSWLRLWRWFGLLDKRCSWQKLSIGKLCTSLKVRKYFQGHLGSFL